MQLTVKTIPIPKARARTTRCGTYTPQKTKDFEQLIAYEFVQSNQPMLQGALFATINFGLPIPKSWSKQKKQDALDYKIKPISKPDIDNLFKSVTDALNGLAYADDSQITGISCLKYYTDTPEVVIVINEIN